MNMKQTFTGALLAATLVVPMLAATPAMAKKSVIKSATTSEVAVKRGTVITGKIETTLDSGKNADGDTFTIKMAPGMFQNKALKGAILEGHVEGVKSAAKFGKKGAMAIEIDDILLPNGKMVEVSAKLNKAPKPEGKMMRNMALALGGAVVGHHVAKSTGSSHGALKGAIAGGAVALAMPGGNVVIKKGTKLDIKFTGDVSL